MEILIKNMVCPRCIRAVERILQDLELPFQSVELGRAVVVQSPSDQQWTQLRAQLRAEEFELLLDETAMLVERTKQCIIRHIHYAQYPTLTWSVLLAEDLTIPYDHLSRAFSQEAGMTIEQFIQQQRIERVKELLSYGELTIAQIADRTGYGSSAYLSRQFKQVTGCSPSAWQKSGHDRNPLDRI